MDAAKKILFEILFAAIFFLVSVAVGAIVKMNNPDCYTCGATIGLTVGWICFMSLQPALWAKAIRRKWRLISFGAGVIGGIVVYLGLETYSIYLLVNGHAGALTAGMRANNVAEISAIAISAFVIKKIKAEKDAKIEMAI